MPFTTDIPAENTDPWYAEMAAAWESLRVFIDGLESDIALPPDLSIYTRFVFVTDGNPSPARPGPPGGLVLWIDTRTTQSTDPPAMGSQDIIIGGAPAPAPEPPTIITTAFNSMVMNSPFTQQIVVVGDPPLTFGATDLPAGLTMGATGIVSGTPTVAGSGSASVTVENVAGSDEQVIPWTVAASLSPPVLGPPTLNEMTQNQAFTQTLTNTGGPIASVSTLGTVPPGLSVSLNGGLPVVAGTPTGSGAYSFTVRATNAAGSDDQLYTGTITAAPPTGSASVFGSASPGAADIYTDGGGSLRQGNRFQTDLAVVVTGLKLWNPPAADPTLLGTDVTAYAYLNDYQGAQLAGSITWGSTPVATKVHTATRVAGEWTEILFDEPITLPALTTTPGENDVLTLAVQYAGGQYYIIVPGLLADPIFSAAGHVSLSQASDPGRGVNTLITGTTTAYYAIDIIFEVP
jgi:hypothetical protein